MREKIYLIRASEFGEKSSYCTVTLRSFADGVVAYGSVAPGSGGRILDPVMNVNELIGKKAYDLIRKRGKAKIGTIVYVRNETRKTDYEILIDCRRFRDAVYAVFQYQEAARKNFIPSLTFYVPEVQKGSLEMDTIK